MQFSALNMPDTALVDPPPYNGLDPPSYNDRSPTIAISHEQLSLRLNGAAQQSGSGSSEQTDGPMRVLDSELARAQAQVPERALLCTTGEIALDIQHQCDLDPCTTRSGPSEGTWKILLMPRVPSDRSEEAFYSFVRNGVSQEPVPFKPTSPCPQDIGGQEIDREPGIKSKLYNRDTIHFLEEFFHIGEIAVNNQQQCDPAPCTTRSEPRKGAKKRDRDRNWTDEETSLLVECKRTAFHDNGSAFRKPKSNATNWDAISRELRNNLITKASEKTGDQCRLRWDTLVKSHRIIKEQCVQKSKGYAELTEEEMNELKLATALDKGWYVVIDTIKSKSVARTQKVDMQSSSIGDFSNPESRIANVLLDPVEGSGNAPTDPDAHSLFLDGAPAVSTQDFQPGSPTTQIPNGKPERRNSSRKQIAIPGFFSMNFQLRATLLDLILGARFLKERLFDPVTYEPWTYELWPERLKLSLSCRWLSIIQNRSCSELYNDVNMLVKLKLVYIFVSDELDEDFNRIVCINQSRFRIFNKYVKKVILHNAVYDTHWIRVEDKTISTLDSFSVPQRIRVLKLDTCGELMQANLRGLRKLRSLCIVNCQKLLEVTGWKFLRELGWLEIDTCSSYRDYPDLQDLPSLREFRIFGLGVANCPPRHELHISQCVRLRRLEIWCDKVLEESGDLSSLKCLEILSFEKCTALSTISGLGGLHLLTSLSLRGCKVLQRLPDIGHMKELVRIGIGYTDLEEIPGVEKLVSLKYLDCIFSKLKRLPDLHHLPGLRKVVLRGTPLIEDDPLSFYFDKEVVPFNWGEVRHVDVSDISDTEYDILSDSDGAYSDDSLSSVDADRLF